MTRVDTPMLSKGDRFMPFETEGAPDEFDALMADQEVANSGATPSDTASLPDALKPSSHGATKDELILGKYKSQDEFVKAHKSLRGEFDKRSQKLNTLESLLKNRDIQEQAARDPQLRDALAKAGYELALEREEEQDEQQGGEWDGDESDPRYMVAQAESKQELRWEIFEFQQDSLGFQSLRPFLLYKILAKDTLSSFEFMTFKPRFWTTGK